MRSGYKLACPSCGKEALKDVTTGSCSQCGGFLEYKFDDEYLKKVEFSGQIMFWRYRPVLPEVKKTITLGEGGTPIQTSKRLGGTLDLENLFLKDETRNPTNSYKDRAASLIVSDASSKGFDSLICATNGNQGASLAAYSATAGIACHLIVPMVIDMGKLAQMIVYDAEVEESGESIGEAINKAASIEKETGWYQATAELNPLSIEATKTISFEIVEQVNVPDWVIVAMGSGATIHAIWKGFKELEVMGIIDSKPRLVGVQARGCAPIAEAFILGKKNPVRIDNPSTEATAIRVVEPIYGIAALKALEESGGIAVSVTDEEMLRAEKEIARSEGIFAEPASSATVACLSSLMESGEIDRRDLVSSLITSSGLKTNDILLSLKKRRKSPGIGSSLATKERVLRIIQSRSTYGYDIWKLMKREMTLGAIYQHLSDLEKRGLITTFSEGKRRYLKITDKGGRVLLNLDELRSLL